MNPIGLTLMAAVSVAQLISLTSGEAISNAISYGEDDLLGLESADAVVSLPALDLSSGLLPALLPLAPPSPSHFRPKRKPQQRFRFTDQGRPRFKPRGRLSLNAEAESENEVEPVESIVQTTVDPRDNDVTEPTPRTSFVPQLRRKLSFPKRTRPTFFDATTLPTTEAPTTTPEPVTILDRETTRFQIDRETTRFQPDRETTRFQALEDLFGTAGGSSSSRQQARLPVQVQPVEPVRLPVEQPRLPVEQPRLPVIQPVEQARQPFPQSFQEVSEEPEQQLDLLNEIVQEPLPVALPQIVSNSVDDQPNILEEVRARTVAITGAQPVGVTRNVSSRSKSARLLKATGPRRGAGNGGNNGNTGGRGPTGAARRNKFRVKSQGRNVQAADFQTAEDKRVLETPLQDLELAAERRDLSAATNLPTVPPTGIRKGGLSGGGRHRSSQHKVGTVERYRFENEDGSITWGYENEDGSYKEETIGVDCITRGKYGYIDPTGKVREYSYSSGVKCDPLTRKVESDNNQAGNQGSDRGINRLGVFDYNQQKFIMPDGRKVRVVVNDENRARGRRH